MHAQVVPVDVERPLLRELFARLGLVDLPLQIRRVRAFLLIRGDAPSPPRRESSRSVEPLRPRPLFVVLVEHHAGRIARLAAAVRESRVTVIVTHRAASAFLFQRGFPVSFLARLLLVVLRLTLASEHFLLRFAALARGAPVVLALGRVLRGVRGGARPPPGGPMPPGGPPGGPSNRPAGPPAAKNRSRSSRSIARVRFATERNFLSDLFVPRYRTARYGARGARRGCLGHSVERRWRCARILGAPGGAARSAAALGDRSRTELRSRKSQRHDAVCRLLRPVEVPPDRQSSLQKPKKHFFNKRRKKERLVGATSRSAREELSSEQTSMRGRATSVSRDGSVLGERRELAPASPWEDDPACLSRSLYDTPSDTDTSRDDEDEEPVCYFYLAPRGVLTRGVGASRAPRARETAAPRCA